MKNIFLIFMITLWLSGCDNDRLKNENRELKAELNSKYAEHMAETEEYNRAASVYMACKIIFPVCPDPMLSEGENAIQAGYSGGDYIYWFALIIKLFIVGSFLGGIVSGFKLAYSIFTKPTHNDIQYAIKVIAKADEVVNEEKAKLEEIRSSYYELKKLDEQARRDLEESILELQDAADDINYAKQEIKELEKRIEELDAIKKAFGDSSSGSV